jgi:hypothetical protein
MKNPETFDLPSPAALDEITREFKLNTSQRRELELVLQHAREDLEGYFRTRIGRGPRKDRMDQLAAVDKAIARLVDSLGEDLDLMNDNLPFECREAITWCASAQLIAEVTGQNVSEAGARVRHKEQVMGLHHGARILARQLQLIRKPIRAVLAEKSTDPGGPEPDHLRAFLIRELAKAAPRIIGQSATGTADGKFHRLIAAVFAALKINDAGLEKAIERQLYSADKAGK